MENETLVWICPLCGEENTGLFCKNFPKTIIEPDDPRCLGKHPQYWELTAHWPVRYRRPRFYIT